jgi:hypothetical protein
MRRIWHPSAIVALALLLPAQAAAASPQIYVGSGPAYTVAFKVDGSAVSVLALDAPLFCSETGPSHDFGPGSISAFRTPTPMRQGPDGLEALLGGGGGPSSKIEATFDGTKLSGAFAFDFSEESFHCQTAGFYAARPEVPFEAALYEAVGTGPTLPAAAGERPIYYGSEGGTEVLLETVKDSIEVRGAAASKCPVKGVKPSAPLTSLFDDVVGAKRKADGSFARTIRAHGKIGHKAWSESTSVTGVVGDEEIAGFYSRSTTVRPKNASPRSCTTGSLPFRAVRYLPAAGS